MKSKQLLSMFMQTTIKVKVKVKVKTL